MAMKAVGWLSQNLGWNIAGRPANSVDGAGAADRQTAQGGTSSSPTAPSEQGYFAHVGNLVFGTTAASQHSSGGASATSNPFSGGGTAEEIENAELDEQGLPKTRNWYYFDEALQRWNVSSSAPQSVKDEFAARLRHEEEEKAKAMRFPEPPPPPPPTFVPSAYSPVARSPLVPQYAVPTYFSSDGKP